MLNLLLSFVAAVCTALVVRLAGFSWYAGIVPAAVVFVGAFLLLGRRIAQKVQAIVSEAQKELSIQASTPKEQKQRVERAVKMLESAIPLGRWQFLIEGEMHAQIAMLLYMVKDLPGAEAHFAKASPRNAMAHALRAAMHYQRKEHEAMERAFEQAVKHGKKESLVWAAYTWCLSQMGRRDQAMRVVARALEANPSDDKLKGVQAALQNDKKVKMKPYEPLWWQFGLETPPLQMASGARQVRFQRH